MIKKFTITSTKFEGELVLKYALNGYLMGFENNAQLSEEQHRFFLGKFPIDEGNLRLLLSKTNTLSFTEIDVVPTFDDFWIAYNYKHDKVLAIKEWDKLNVTDKVLAVAGIKKYNKHIESKNIGKVYPVRYIKYRKWENE